MPHYWILMSCIDLYLIEKIYPAKLFSIHCVNTSGLKLNISIQCFRRRPQQVSLRPLHRDVDSFNCDRWTSQTMYISKVPRSYMVVVYADISIIQKFSNLYNHAIIFNSVLKNLFKRFLHFVYNFFKISVGKADFQLLINRFNHLFTTMARNIVFVC